jgi:hypothetical protein
VAAIDTSNLGTSLAVGPKTTLRAQLLVRGKEAGRVGEIKHHPPAKDADGDGHETLNNDCMAVSTCLHENNDKENLQIHRQPW